MVPSIFVCLQALPLTPNGKVDRNALPAPEMDPERPRHVVEAPLTPLHRQLVDIWRDVLHVQQIGINDNFFDLGGHSLLAFQIISRLRESFSVELPLSSLFETPTVAALAEGLEAGRWQRTGDPVPRLERFLAPGISRSLSCKNVCGSSTNCSQGAMLTMLPRRLVSKVV